MLCDAGISLCISNDTIQHKTIQYDTMLRITLFINKSSTIKEESSATLQDATQSSDFPFVKNNLILRVRPIKDVRDLSIIWSVDSTRTLYRNNPCRLIGFLLGSLSSIFLT